MNPAEALAYFSEVKRAFHAAFNIAPHGGIVMEDLSLYCHEKRTCFHTDDAIRNVLEGRRQVMLRIREFLELSPEQLVALNTKEKTP